MTVKELKDMVWRERRQRPQRNTILLNHEAYVQVYHELRRGMTNHRGLTTLPPDAPPMLLCMGVSVFPSDVVEPTWDPIPTSLVERFIAGY